jgi:hypothetical protein
VESRTNRRIFIMRKLLLLSVAGLVGLATTAGASAGFDFGTWRDRQLTTDSQRLFGVKKPLKESSTESVDQATAEADPTSLATVAKGLHVEVATSDPNAGANMDMIALWPNDSDPSGPHRLQRSRRHQPSRCPAGPAFRRQRGDVLSGTIACDPVRRTPWGTILVGEENGSSGR